MVPAFVTCERWFFKAGPWLRNERPVGSDITELLLLLKIAARKTVILSFGFVPSQHMRLNLYFVHLQASIGAVQAIELTKAISNCSAPSAGSTQFISLL